MSTLHPMSLRMVNTLEWLQMRIQPNQSQSRYDSTTKLVDIWLVFLIVSRGVPQTIEIVVCHYNHYIDYFGTNTCWPTIQRVGFFSCSVDLSCSYLLCNIYGISFYRILFLFAVSIRLITSMATFLDFNLPQLIIFWYKKGSGMVFHCLTVLKDNCVFT